MGRDEKLEGLGCMGVWPRQPYQQRAPIVHLEEKSFNQKTKVFHALLC